MLGSECLCTPPPLPPNSYVEILILNVVIIGGGDFGRYKVMRVEPPGTGLVPLLKGPQRARSFLSPCADTEKTAVHEPGSGLLPDT